MRTSPARIEAVNKNGFTFPEVLTALLITVLTVYAATAALLTILRQEDAGLRALHTALALQQTACRHFLPPAERPEENTSDQPAYFQPVQFVVADS
ncbi:MAG: hypothetical protein PHG65_11165, partial [Kiritimatiellae bacterium]|nr:hypothetical protein [Kiritimatiellia bacterium]